VSEASAGSPSRRQRRQSRRTGAFGLAKWLIGGQRQMEYSVRSSAGPLSGFAGIIATGLAGTASTFPLLWALCSCPSGVLAPVVVSSALTSRCSMSAPSLIMDSAHVATTWRPGRWVASSGTRY
jgi:hypothetical protein